MPRDNRALTRAARDRAHRTQLPYQRALEDVRAIGAIVAEEHIDWDTAEALYDSEGNDTTGDDAILIEEQIEGWDYGCPDCGGYGTGSYACTCDEDSNCPECGADPQSPYCCRCA